MNILQIINNQIKLPYSVQDGKYFVKVIPVKPKTPRECQEMYFAKIDELISITGWSRYDLHEHFKKHSSIETTKNLDFEEWCKFLFEFKFWVLNNFDIAI